MRNRQSRLSADAFAQPYPKPAVPVGQPLSITGDLAGDDDVELHGRFSGTIDVEGMVLVGKTAEVRAEIKGSTVVVLGFLLGNVTASGRVVVASPGDLIGNVRALGLVVSEGAGFRGHVTLGPVLDEQRPAVRPVGATGANGEAFRLGERTAKSLTTGDRDVMLGEIRPRVTRPRSHAHGARLSLPCRARVSLIARLARDRPDRRRHGTPELRPAVLRGTENEG